MQDHNKMLSMWCADSSFMCREALTRPDKITAVTRESISTVNKARLTTRGNNLLLQFKSSEQHSASLSMRLIQQSDACHQTGLIEGPLVGEVFLYSRTTSEHLHLPAETSPKLVQSVQLHFLTTAWRSFLLQVSLTLTCFTLVSQLCWNGSICATNALKLWRHKKIPECLSDYFHKDAKRTKSFLPESATRNYSKSDKATWYKLRGQLVCRFSS